MGIIWCEISPVELWAQIGGGATPETLQKTNYTPKKKGDFLGLVRSYSWFVTPKKNLRMSLEGGVRILPSFKLKVHTSIDRQGYLEEYTISDLNKKAALKDLM